MLLAYCAACLWRSRGLPGRPKTTPAALSASKPSLANSDFNRMQFRWLQGAMSRFDYTDSYEFIEFSSTSHTSQLPLSRTMVRQDNHCHAGETATPGPAASGEYAVVSDVVRVVYVAFVGVVCTCAVRLDRCHVTSTRRSRGERRVSAQM